MFLSQKYLLAYQHFSLLMLTAIILPMMITAIIFITRDHMKALLANAVISSLTGIIVSISIGMSGHSELIALGTMSYTFTFSLIGIMYAIKQEIFYPMDFFRAIPDTLHFVKTLLQRKSWMHSSISSFQHIIIAMNYWLVYMDFSNKPLKISAYWFASMDPRMIQ